MPVLESLGRPYFRLRVQDFGLVLQTLSSVQGQGLPFGGLGFGKSAFVPCVLPVSGFGLRGLRPGDS